MMNHPAGRIGKRLILSVKDDETEGVKVGELTKLVTRWWSCRAKGKGVC